MRNTINPNNTSSKVVIGSAVTGMIIMGLVALGISQYDGYTDELLVYQSLATGLIGGLILSGSYLLFARIKSPKPQKYQPPIIEYTLPFENKRTPIPSIEYSVNKQSGAKSTFKKILYYLTYFSIFTFLGTSLGFLGGLIFLFANLSDIFDNAANQYSILVFLLLPLQLIGILLTVMAIGAIMGVILGFILKFLRK